MISKKEIIPKRGITSDSESKSKKVMFDLIYAAAILDLCKLTVKILVFPQHNHII